MTTRILTILAALTAVLFVASAATAADWTTSEGGTTVCNAVRPGGTCYVATAGATTSAIALLQCKAWTVVVYGTGASVMPQTCTGRSCASSEDVLSSALTGDSPNTFVTSTAPFDYIRLVTTSSITATITCGR